MPKLMPELLAWKSALQVLVVDVAWVADHVNDSGYRELHRYLAADTDQILADMGCDLNDLEIPMCQVLHYHVQLGSRLHLVMYECSSKGGSPILHG